MDPVRRSSFGIRLRQYREAAALSQGELADRAGLSLRGISDIERGVRNKPRWETVRMLADGLSLTEAEFDSLVMARSSIRQSMRANVDRRVGELPVYLTSFVGRERESSLVRTMLKDQQVRLLTLKGPGGVGKTRVAVEVAKGMVAEYPGGIVFVDLAPVRELDMVLPAIAASLGVSVPSNRDIGDAVLVALHDRKLLMSLDNFEHVLGAATEVVNLLKACPGLDVLVTSRTSLRVAAESIVPVQPLALPESRELESLRQNNAVTLFTSRAEAISPSFVLNEHNASDVAAVINKLEGMPLAIELAAARLRLFSVPELNDRLNSRMDVLANGAVDFPDRHRSMLSTIAWSYDLLPPHVQDTFQTMAIFPDGCAIETLIALYGSDSHIAEAEILAAVESLVDNSLVQIRDPLERGSRYQMLQSIREYGLDRLAASGRLEAVRMGAHRSWCLPLMDATDFMITRPDVAWCLDQIGAEYENLREHVSWLINTDRVADALEVSGYLSFFRGIRGYFEEGRRELEFLLEHPKNQEHTISRTRAVIGHGKLCNYQSDPREGYRWLQEGAKLASKLGHVKYLEVSLNAAGTSMYMLGEIDDAETLFIRALQIATEADHRFQIAVGKHCLSLIAESRGNSDLAEKLMLESYQVCVGEDFVWSVASGKLIVSTMHLRKGELDEAENLVHEAQDLYMELQDWRDMPGSYLKLAEIARLKGNLVGAKQYILHAVEIGQNIGSPMDVAQARLAFAQISRLENELDIAHNHAVQALEWLVRCGNDLETLSCLWEIAEIALLGKQFERAAFTIGVAATVMQSESANKSPQQSEALSRLEAQIRAALSDHTWCAQISRGQSSSPLIALAEFRTWTACQF